MLCEPSKATEIRVMTQAVDPGVLTGVLVGDTGIAVGVFVEGGKPVAVGTGVSVGGAKLKLAVIFLSASIVIDNGLALLLADPPHWLNP